MNHNEKCISDFQTGEVITRFFVVRKKEVKSKRDGGYYLSLELGDASGRILANLWDPPPEILSNLQKGDTVKVKATVVEYNDHLELSVEKIRKAIPEDAIDPKSFLPGTENNIEEQYQKLLNLIQNVENPFFHLLLENIFCDPSLKDRIREAPGGKLWHHAYLGGLVEHTLTVAKLCLESTRFYPDLSKDLLCAGALLHDIGKIDEYEYHQGFIEFTDKGRLWGHVTLGAELVLKKIAQLETKAPFPEELSKCLVHLILSHHGKPEQGASVVPMTREAMVLHYVDELDSKVNALTHIIEKEKKNLTHWSKYIPLLDRFIYLGESIFS